MFRKRRIMIREIDNLPIYYETDGTGSNKALLLHGWGCDAHLMKPVADALHDRFQTMLPDFPGHGKSGRPPEPWGVPEYASCLKKLIMETGFFPCHVIAHSFGCRIAAWLAANDPELFDKIVFTGAAGIRPVPSEESRKRSERYKKLRKYCEWFSKIPFMASTVNEWEEQLRQKFGSRDYNALDEEMRKTFVKVINQDLSDLYPRFRSSTLLIWGDSDTETPLWMGRKMEELIPDAGLVVFEGGSHFAYLEQAARFNIIVLQFLKGDE